MLRTSPIAVKMLEKEADIPKEAFLRLVGHKPDEDRRILGGHPGSRRISACTHRRRSPDVLRAARQDAGDDGRPETERARRILVPDHIMFMQPDFPLPDFYKDMFKSWGMDSE